MVLTDEYPWFHPQLTGIYRHFSYNTPKNLEKILEDMGCLLFHCKLSQRPIRDGPNCSANREVVAFHGGSVVKNLPAMQEMQVQSLDQEDSLEKEIETCSSILALETPWTNEPGEL